MAMSKKDYRLIADAIRTAPGSKAGAKRLMAVAIGRAINEKGGNPRFDMNRFIAAATEETE